MVEARQKKRNTKRSHPPALRELLHDSGEFADQHRYWNDFPIHSKVRLRGFAPLPTKHAKIGAHPRVYHRNVLGQQHNFLHRRLIDEARWKLLFRGNDNAILCFDSEGGATRSDGIKSILDLHELT